MKNKKAKKGQKKAENKQETFTANSIVLGRSDETNVHTPSHTGDGTHQVPDLDGLDERKVDKRNKGPQLVARQQQGPKLLQRLGEHLVEVDAGKVDGAGLDPKVDGLGKVGDAGCMAGCCAQGAHKGAKEQRVDGRAERLV